VKAVAGLKNYPFSNYQLMYSLRANKFFLIGFMGSGKSYWGKFWAEEMNLPFIELDALIEEQEGKTIAELFEQKGETYFRQVESSVLKNCKEHQSAIISTGGGAPCFFDNMEWMNEHGTSIYLEATPQELARRLQDERTHRPVLKNVPPDQLQDFIEQKLKEREPFYRQAKFTLDVSQLNDHTLLDLNH
jgi:shikimate kinase